MRRTIVLLIAIIPLALAACSTPTAPMSSARARRATLSADIVPDTVPPPPDHGVTIGGSTR